MFFENERNVNETKNIQLLSQIVDDLCFEEGIEFKGVMDSPVISYDYFDHTYTIEATGNKYNNVLLNIAKSLPINFILQRSENVTILTIDGDQLDKILEGNKEVEQKSEVKNEN